MYNLLIPAAKYISEDLQKIGRMPPILYPLGDKIVFDHIRDRYGSEINHTYIICYEGFELVNNRIKKNNCTSIIKLDSLKDLGHSILVGIKNIKNKKESLIINFGDTITGELINEYEYTDSFFYSEEYYSNRWTFFNINEKELEIIDRPDDSINKKGKAFVGVFLFSDVDLLIKCLDDTKNSNNSFYNALKKYHQTKKLTDICIKEWSDIGHMDRYLDSKRIVQSRSFNYINIDENRGILTKNSDDKEKFIGEIEWYLKIPSELKYCCPRIFSYSLSYERPYISMEYYSFHTIHDLFLYGSLSSIQWKTIFSKIHFICNDFSKYSITDKNKIRNSLEDMYLNKTILRLNKILELEKFKTFVNKPIFVNGKKYVSLNKLKEKIKSIIPNMLYNINKFCIIHGDLCFTNILIDDNLTTIKLIDPRGKFGSFDIYGDQRYEMAKLLHSVEGGYDLIIKDEFNIEFDLSNNSIVFSLNNLSNTSEASSILKEIFEDMILNNEKEIHLIEALLFITMIPLHNENINHQMAMLGTGLELLSNICDINCD